MPRSFSIDHPPKFEDIRLGGIALAADLVLKEGFIEARKVLTKLLEFSPGDIEVMSQLGNVYGIAEKYGRKLDRMKTKEKIKLFNKVKVFT